jgi:hypothetical protein
MHALFSRTKEEGYNAMVHKQRNGDRYISLNCELTKPGGINEGISNRQNQ